MQKLVAILMVSAAFTACGGSSSDLSSSPIPLDQAPGELAKAFCQAEKKCSPFYYALAYTNTDCVAAFTEQYKQATFDQLQTAIDAKTLKYDGSLAQQCISALTAGSCENLDNHLPDVCQKTFAGTVATGGDCNLDQECAGLSRCDISGSTCPGTCAPRSSAGVACGKDSDCALGLTCSTATQHCSTPAAEGEACKGDAGECAAGLLCVGNDDTAMTSGTCMTEAATLLGKKGASCDLQKGPWCASGLSCVVDSASVKDGLVASCHEPAGMGGECGFGLPSQCPTGQACPIQLTDLLAGNATAKCADLPAEGDACGSSLGITRCAANLVCDDTTAPLKPVCIKQHDLGESCSSDAVCHSAHCVAKTCVPESACAK